jgi:hypothetical protein
MKEQILKLIREGKELTLAPILNGEGVEITIKQGTKISCGSISSRMIEDSYGDILELFIEECNSKF